MTNHKCVVLVLSVFLLLASATAQQPDKKYLGRWDLTVTGDKEYPSWLELTDEGGKLTANFVGRWGNSRPLPKVDLTDGKLTFTSPKEEEDSNADMVYEGKLTGETLSGTVNAPKGGTWKWTARRAPKLPEPKSVKWGKPISLFNGKDLTGWAMTDPNTKTPWKVVDGVLVSPGHGPEIINDQKFQNFKLHVEFNRGEQSNSGVYLRGRYEVQIENESVEEPASHHNGGVYGFIAPNPELPRVADKWQTYDITLLGRTITVVQDGKTVIDHKEIPGITGGALDSHEELPGPIYLQGSEKGHVSFRNITITPAEK